MGGCELIENLNKFEIAEKIEELKKWFNDPEACFIELPHRLGVYDEVMNMPKDKDGGVPKYYISDSLKNFFRIYEDIKDKKNRKRTSPAIVIEHDFQKDIFKKKYCKD